jgi:hypothetical protein
MKNKKTCLLLLASSALLLTGCGDSKTGEVAAPKGGTDTTLSAKAQKLAKAASGTVASDAFSATIGVPSFSAKVTTTSGSAEYNVSNAKASLAVSGYTKTAADFKAALSVSLDSMNAKSSVDAAAMASLAGSNAGIAAGASAMGNISLSKAAFNAYISNKNAYLDFSDANLYSLITSKAGAAASMSASDVEKMLPKKTLIAGAITDKSMPLFTTEQLTKINDTLSGYATTIANAADKLDKYFTVQDNKDGSTVIWTKLDLQTVAALEVAFDSTTSTSSVDASSAISSMLAEAGNSKLDLTASLTFDDSHILSAYVYEDSTIEAQVGSGTTKSTMSIVSKGRLNIDLAYGDKVVIKLPSDLNTYTASPLFSGLLA